MFRASSMPYRGWKCRAFPVNAEHGMSKYSGGCEMGRGRFVALAILVAIGMMGSAGVASAEGYNSSTNLGERLEIGLVVGEHYQNAQDSIAALMLDQRIRR